MQKESRVKKSLLNAKVNLYFYFVILFLAFFSRKIFIDCLGIEFIGLTTTLHNLLGFLSLAELGIGTAIGYVLYKPLADNNRSVINDIISVLAYMYRRVGLFILAAGVILSCFLPFIFKKADYSFGVIYFAYYSFLASSLIGYFINFRQTLLAADQKNYVVTIFLQTSNCLKLIIQMYLAYKFSNPYFWIGIELLFGILYSVILNLRIKRTYPWLYSSIDEGKVSFKRYPEITKYIKQLFVHKIVGFTQGQTTPFLIYAFVSLKSVACYGNYMTVVQKLSLLVNSVLGSTEASVGNLIANSDDKHKVKIVFHEMMAIRFFIAGAFMFLIYHLIEPFISLWLGSEYIMGKMVLLLILLDVFISQYRGAVDQFLYGYGLFSDVWASILQACIFLTVAIVGGYFWKLEGVLLASVISKYLIVGLWKPYFLFKKGFLEPVLSYWKLWFRNILAIGITYSIVNLLIVKLVSINQSNLLTWGIYSLILAISYVTVNALIMYFVVPGTKSLIQRIVYRNKTANFNK